MAPIPFIGIAGRARSGKDTLADMLLSSGVARYRVAFADPIKLMATSLLGIEREDWDYVKDDLVDWASGMTPRQLAQLLGDWGRGLAPDFWIRRALSLRNERGDGLVVTDVRYENEAAAVRAAGGLIVHIRRAAAPTVAAHSSEAGVAVTRGDLVLINDGTIEQLRDRVHGIDWAGYLEMHRTKHAR